MSKWIKELIAKNPRSLSVVGVFFVLALLGALIAYALERHSSTQTIDPLTILLFALLVPTAVSSLFITGVSYKWLVRQWETETRDTVFVETLDDPLAMARRRYDIVATCKKLEEDVYCTSHCNLFFDPIPSQPPSGQAAQREEIVGMNRQFFRQLAKLTVESRSGLKLLLHYPTEEAFSEEMAVRIDVYLEVCEAKRTTLDGESFEPRQLLLPSLNDYLIFEDHIFVTLRKASKGGKAEYVYIRSSRLAEHYRAWLKDLFDKGHQCDPPRVEEEDFRVKYEELLARLTKERDRVEVQSV